MRAALWLLPALMLVAAPAQAEPIEAGPLTVDVQGVKDGYIVTIGLDEPRTLVGLWCVDGRVVGCSYFGGVAGQPLLGGCGVWRTGAACADLRAGYVGVAEEEGQACATVRIYPTGTREHRCLP